MISEKTHDHFWLAGEQGNINSTKHPQAAVPPSQRKQCFDFRVTDQLIELSAPVFITIGQIRTARPELAGEAHRKTHLFENAYSPGKKLRLLQLTGGGNYSDSISGSDWRWLADGRHQTLSFAWIRARPETVSNGSTTSIEAEKGASNRAIPPVAITLKGSSWPMPISWRIPVTRPSTIAP